MAEDKPRVKNPAGNPNWVKGRSANPQTQWKKGESGCPNGRQPGDPPLTTVLRRLIEDQSFSRARGQTHKERMMAALIRNFIKGNSSAIKEVFERLEGKVRQEVSTEVSGPNGKPIDVIVNTDELRARILSELNSIASARKP